MATNPLGTEEIQHDLVHVEILMLRLHRVVALLAHLHHSTTQVRLPSDAVVELLHEHVNENQGSSTTDSSRAMHNHRISPVILEVVDDLNRSRVGGRNTTVRPVEPVQMDDRHALFANSHLNLRLHNVCLRLRLEGEGSLVNHGDLHLAQLKRLSGALREIFSTLLGVLTFLFFTNSAIFLPSQDSCTA